MINLQKKTLIVGGTYKVNKDSKLKVRNSNVAELKAGETFKLHYYGIPVLVMNGADEERYCSLNCLTKLHEAGAIEEILH
jgi:hypothetical protein